MFEVVSNEEIAPKLHRMVILAPRVARARKPGQFVIVRVGKGAERIPLTIADDDPEAGTITLIIQAVGRSTQEIVATPVGGALRDVAGPLGQPTHIDNFGKVVCVGGGVGTAVLFPLAKALAKAGNDLTTIIGGRSEKFVVLRDELGAFSNELLCTTEDGSLGETGFVTAPLKRLLEAGNGGRPQAVYAIGPVPMMKAVADLTRDYGVKTIVSLNPLMVDGTGMCGGCRVTVGGEIKFACVDGPEFDGHLVDFAELAGRQAAYHELDEHGCRLVDADGNVVTNPALAVAPARVAPVVAAAPAAPVLTPAAAVAIAVAATADAPAPALTAKERMAIERVAMPEQDAEQRSHNFTEVNLGLTAELAVLEAQRCIQCKNKPCMSGCPVEVRIPDFLERIAARDFAGAAQVLLTDNALPATTGRVCPQEVQCEGVCVRGKKGEPVAIGWLERFVADWAAGNLEFAAPQITQTGKSVAVVGAGPGGLTVAGELARLGHGVHIFEALHDTGGVLRYGIPEFRLPKAIVDKEVDNLRRLGVEVECDVIIGRTLTVQELIADFDAVFVANGAGLPMFLNIPGENLKGVYSANEYLTRVNLMGAYMNYDGVTPIARGKRVLVFGGGNVAMDAVRTARRLGAEQAICAYRRTRAEMPARIEEIVHAEQEGIDFQFLMAPLEILSDAQGWVRAVRMQRMELGEPDDSGRRRPVPVAGSEFEVECDVAVVALGTLSNPLLTNATPAITLNKWGNIVTDETHATSMPGVFAGGDIVRGGATVILAMGDGKAAARSIDSYLKG
jgi:glutamate synthase (NADPH/NADH) small chain